jgi:hypothetical protein
VDPAGKEGAGGQHHRRRLEAQAGVGDRAAHDVAPVSIGVDEQVVDRRLEQREVGLRFHRAADEGAIQRAVGLAAGGAYRGALGRVEPAPLDAGGVGGTRHHPAERVDLAYQVALADAADRRVAAHRADRLDVVREQQGARAGARCRERGLGAGVAAADHDHVVTVEGIAHAQFAWMEGWAAFMPRAGACGDRAAGIIARRDRDGWHASCDGFPRTRCGKASGGAGWIGTGLAAHASGKPGAGCRGTSGPFLCAGFCVLARARRLAQPPSRDGGR